VEAGEEWGGETITKCFKGIREKVLNPKHNHGNRGGPQVGMWSGRTRDIHKKTLKGRMRRKATTEYHETKKRLNKETKEDQKKILVFWGGGGKQLSVGFECEKQTST